MAMMMSVFRRGRLAEITDVIDPGGVRTRYAFRASVAMLTSFLIVYSTTRLLDQTVPGIGLFTLLVCFISNFILIQVKGRAASKVLVLSLFSIIAATLLISMLDRNSILAIVLMAGVFFLAYYARGYSLVLHIIGLIAVAALYFAWIFSVIIENVHWFLFAAVVAAVINLVFWYYILPTDRHQEFRRLVSSYYLRGAVVLGDLASSIESGSAPKEIKKDINKQLNRLERSRTNIEILVVEFLEQNGPTAQTEAIRTTILSTSRAIRIICTELISVHQLFDEKGDSSSELSGLLRDISLWLSNRASKEGVEELRQRMQDVTEDIRNDPSSYDPEQKARVVHIIIGIRELFENVTYFRTLLENVESSTAFTQSTQAKSDKAKPLKQTTRIGGLEFSLSTWMGVQALVSAALAISAAKFLGMPMEQSFWFAMITVSGSLGETRLKSLSRIFGTILGILVGLALAFVVGDSSFLVVATVVAAFFLLELNRTVSMSWFVFFLVIISVVSIAYMGADPLKYSGTLVVSSLIGVTAAILSTSFLFPIRIDRSYRKLLSRYLTDLESSIRYYLKGYEEGRIGIPNTVLSSMADSLQEMRRISHAKQLESNPFSSFNRDNLDELGTIMDGLNLAIAGLGVDEGSERNQNQPPPEVMVLVARLLQTNLNIIIADLSTKSGRFILKKGDESLFNMVTKAMEPGSVILQQPYRRDLPVLVSINDILKDLAIALQGSKTWMDKDSVKDY